MYQPIVLMIKADNRIVIGNAFSDKVRNSQLRLALDIAYTNRPRNQDYRYKQIIKLPIGRLINFLPNDFEKDVLSGLADAVWNGNRVNVEISQAPGVKSNRGGGNRGGNGRSHSRKSGEKRSHSGSRRDRQGGKSSAATLRKESTGGRPSSFRGRFNAAAKRTKRD